MLLAETLALTLALASTGTPREKPGLDAPPDNAARARRGLLPRKVARARPASRQKRAVLVPRAPTWLGEPGDLAPPGELVVELAVARVEEGADPAVPPAAELAVARVEEGADRAPPAPELAVARGEEGAGVVAGPTAELGVEAVAATRPAVPPERAAPPEGSPGGPQPHDAQEPDDAQDPQVRAVVEGAEVELLLVQRLADADAPGPVSAIVTEPQLLVVVVRRPPVAQP